MMRLTTVIRIAAGALALALQASAASAQAVDDTTLPAYRSAYASTIKCFVANGVLTSDAKNAGRSELASAYERKAAQSFKLAFQTGRTIGLSDSDIQAALSGANQTELPTMLRDKAYFGRAVVECRALGLM